MVAFLIKNNYNRKLLINIDVIAGFYNIMKMERCTMAEDKIITTGIKVVNTTPKVKDESEYENPEELYQTLIETIRKYRPATDLSQIEKAYKMAFQAHKDQKRRSGEPYIIHPVSVAIILAELELDKESIIAGILHDIVEDTEVTLEQVSDEFGDEVALLCCDKTRDKRSRNWRK